MHTYIADFVDRHDALNAIEASLARNDARQVWLVSGRAGIGKSYLLEECRARGRAQRIVCARADLGDQRLRTAAALILHLAEQLGASRAPQTLEAARVAAALAQVAPPPSPSPPPTSDMIGATVENVAAGGMVAVGKQITQISGQVVTYVTQTVRYDDPWVQQQTRQRLSSALRDDLTALAPPTLLLLLVDGWSAASTEVKEWLAEHLCDWIVGGAAPQVVAVIAEADHLPNQPRSRVIGQLALQELSAADVEEYWVQRRQLPNAELAGALKFSGGVPLILALIADQIALQAGTRTV